MSIGVGGEAVAGVAALAAGAVNGIAGGGTLISFPALLAIGVPPLASNVTNTVALCPGYLSGTLAAAGDLRVQRRRARRVAPFAAVGGLSGALLLQVTPEATFSAAVPWLVLLAAALLLAQDPVRSWVERRAAARVAAAPGGGAGDPGVRADATPWLEVAVLLGAVYGGFFGAGLGIMLLAVLGVCCTDRLNHLNAVKQMISLLVNVAAAAFFAAGGHVRWELVPVMAVAALVGGAAGSRVAQRVDATRLRQVVVAVGVAVAVALWVG